MIELWLSCLGLRISVGILYTMLFAHTRTFKNLNCVYDCPSTHYIANPDSSQSLAQKLLTKRQGFDLHNGERKQ